MKTTTRLPSRLTARMLRCEPGLKCWLCDFSRNSPAVFRTWLKAGKDSGLLLCAEHSAKFARECGIEVPA